MQFTMQVIGFRALVLKAEQHFLMFACQAAFIGTVLLKEQLDTHGHSHLTIIINFLLAAYRGYSPFE